MTNESTARNRISTKGREASPPSQSENLDEVCCGLRAALLSTSHGKMGKAPIILRIKVSSPIPSSREVNNKEIVGLQFYNVLTYGLCDISTVSTPILIQLLYDLVFSNSLHSSASQSGQVRELYLQCLVSLLRLLSLHASFPGSGTITSKFVESIHARIDQHLSQYLQEKDARSELDGEDFNCEFLFEYALDLLGAMPSEGSYLKDLLDSMGTISSLSKWVNLLSVSLTFCRIMGNRRAGF